VPYEGRHRLGDVAADQQDRTRGGDVGDRHGQSPVQAERPVLGGGRRGHAEAAVVVDVRGAQRHPGELAELVRLLVGQPAATEDRGGLTPVRALDPADLGGDPVQRGIPGDRFQRRVPARPHQGDGQPVGRVEQISGGPSLLTQRSAAAAVGRDVVARCDRAGTDEHPALQGAVRTVGGRG
jgi:hypothetical protein